MLLLCSWAESPFFFSCFIIIILFFGVVRDIIEFSEGIREGGGGGIRVFPRKLDAVEVKGEKEGVFVYVSSLMKEMSRTVQDGPFGNELYLTQWFISC